MKKWLREIVVNGDVIDKLEKRKDKKKEISCHEAKMKKISY